MLWVLSELVSNPGIQPTHWNHWFYESPPHAVACRGFPANFPLLSCTVPVIAKFLVRRGDQDENPASYVDGLVGKTFFVLNKLVGSGHMSGLPVRCI